MVFGQFFRQTDSVHWWLRQFSVKAEQESKLDKSSNLGIKFICSVHYWHLLCHPLGFQFLDFQLRSFVDPKPVELGENAIPLKISLNLLV